MPLRAVCSQCQASYQVREDKAGKTFRCQKCGEPVSVPTAPAEEPVFIVETSEPEAAAAKRDARGGMSLWTILGILAAAFLLSVGVGVVSPRAGSLLMLGWAFGGLGLCLFGLVRLFLSIEGKQRFWLTIKVLLRFVGLKLFYVDADLFNRRSARALGWMATGFVLLLVSLLPASHFLKQTQTSTAAQNGPQAAPGPQVPPDLQFAGAGQNIPGMNPPGQFPPPGMIPGASPMGQPGMLPPGMMPPTGVPPEFASGLPIRHFYAAFDHPPEEIARRVDERFQEFAFYKPGSVRIDATRQSIEFLASYPPDFRMAEPMRNAFAEAGVRLRPRRTRTEPPN